MVTYTIRNEATETLSICGFFVVSTQHVQTFYNIVPNYITMKIYFRGTIELEADHQL